MKLDHVAVIVKGWPRLSETFIAQELLALERLGLKQIIFALRHPHDSERHQLHRELRAQVCYLPEYLHCEPLRVVRGVSKVAETMAAGWHESLAAWWRDWQRDSSRSRLRRFGQACVLAAELPPEIGWIHSHFLHTPASVARYTSFLTGIPWSFSAHAKDIWTTPLWDKQEKLAAARWGVTCSRDSWKHLATLTPDSERLALAYHGLDFNRFPEPEKSSRRDGSEIDKPVRLLSVARAVAKKGLMVLLEALAGLLGNLAWHWTHIGGGTELKQLKKRARQLGLTSRISWLGAQSHKQVIECYQQSDLFVLPCRQTDSGDRDGLPNVLLEAQLLGLACVSTRIAAVPELINDGRSGLLVAVDDPQALREALATLIVNPERREYLGAQGRKKVMSEFNCEKWIGIIYELLRSSLDERNIGRCSNTVHML